MRSFRTRSIERTLDSNFGRYQTPAATPAYPRLASCAMRQRGQWARLAANSLPFLRGRGVLLSARLWGFPGVTLGATGCCVCRRFTLHAAGFVGTGLADLGWRNRDGVDRKHGHAPVERGRPQPLPKQLSRSTRYRLNRVNRLGCACEETDSFGEISKFASFET